MTDWASLRDRIAWTLMGIPTGINRPSQLLLRYGPYRWGAWLIDRGNPR